MRERTERKAYVCSGPGGEELVERPGEVVARVRVDGLAEPERDPNILQMLASVPFLLLSTERTHHRNNVHVAAAGPAPE